MAQTPDRRSEHGADGGHLGLSFPALLGILAANLVFVGAALTQYFAWQFGFAASLGPPAFSLVGAVGIKGCYIVAALGVFTSLGLAVYPQTRPYCGLGVFVGGMAYIGSYGPFYAPHKGILWFNNSIGQAQFAWMQDHAILVVGAGLAFSLGCTLPIIALRSLPLSGSHGTAGWSEGRTMQASDDGLIVGRKDGNLLHYPADGHLMTVAATGTGKGVGSVMPNLLSYEGSALITDIKGENYFVTKDYRSTPKSEGGLGQKTYALDPFQVAEEDPDAFNPLDLLRAGSGEAGADANMLAHMLVPDSGGGSGNSKHFEGEARQFLAGLMLYVAGTEGTDQKTRSLPYVRELLMLPGEPGEGEPMPQQYDASYFDADYEDGARSPRAEPGTGKGIDANGRPMTFEAVLRDMQRRTELFGGRVATAANQLARKPFRERGGVISTAQQNTNFIETKPMKRALSASDFHFSQLKKEKTSIYVIMPPRHLDAFRQWLRLMISCSVTAVTRTPGQPDEKILYLLDEFANLGRMKPVKQAYSLMRGYGIALWIFVQELPQLKGKYQDEWESFWSNADVIQAFGNSDPMTRREISKMAGETTILVKSETSSSGSNPGGTSSSTSKQYSEKRRRLITEDEVRRLPDDQELVFVRGENPVRADKITYYEEEPFEGRAQPNPFEEDVEDTPPRGASSESPAAETPTDGSAETAGSTAAEEDEFDIESNALPDVGAPVDDAVPADDGENAPSEEAEGQPSPLEEKPQREKLMRDLHAGITRPAEEQSAPQSGASGGEGK